MKKAKRTELAVPTGSASVYQRILSAAKRGDGVRLSADEVFELSRDDAIETRANMDMMNREGTPDTDII